MTSCTVPLYPHLTTGSTPAASIKHPLKLPARPQQATLHTPKSRRLLIPEITTVAVPARNMTLPTTLRLLRLLPAITSTATLQFALDEHLIFGTWMDPSL